MWALWKIALFAVSQVPCGSRRGYGRSSGHTVRLACRRSVPRAAAHDGIPDETPGSSAVAPASCGAAAAPFLPSTDCASAHGGRSDPVARAESAPDECPDESTTRLTARSRPEPAPWRAVVGTDGLRQSKFAERDSKTFCTGAASGRRTASPRRSYRLKPSMMVSG